MNHVVNSCVNHFVNPFLNPFVNPVVNPFVGPFESFCQSFCETEMKSLRNPRGDFPPKKTSLSPFGRSYRYIYIYVIDAICS